MKDSSNTVLYQIFYDEESRTRLNPGFIPLDNTSGRRDWHEYWPIRNCLLGTDLQEGRFYGFFSPRLIDKTGLSAEGIGEFLAGLDPDVDVAIFCPFWDQSAFSWNVIEQGEWAHPGFTEMTVALWRVIQPGVDLTIEPNTSRNTIFSNFFVARPAFWRRWLDVCETLFAVAERADTDLSKALNHTANYDRPVAYKVFIMERVASILLANDSGWKSAAFNLFRLSHSPYKTSTYGYQGIISDALKIAFIENGFPEYRNAYFKLRESVKAGIMGREGCATLLAFSQLIVPPSS